MFTFYILDVFEYLFFILSFELLRIEWGGVYRPFDSEGPKISLKFWWRISPKGGYRRIVILFHFVGHNIWWEISRNGSFEPKNGQKMQKWLIFRPRNQTFGLNTKKSGQKLHKTFIDTILPYHSRSH